MFQVHNQTTSYVIYVSAVGCNFCFEPCEKKKKKAKDKDTKKRTCSWSCNISNYSIAVGTKDKNISVQCAEARTINDNLEKRKKCNQKKIISTSIYLLLSSPV